MLKKLILTVVLVLAAAIPVIYAQNTGTEDVETVLYIGTVTDEPDVFVGLAIEGDSVTLYICDGQADRDSISIAQWFIGTVAANAIDITAANGNRVEVTLTADTAAGKLTFQEGTIKEFELNLADNHAALYRSEFAFGDDEFVGGWLVLPDGSVRGAVVMKNTAEIVPATLDKSIIAILIGRNISDGTSNITDGTSNTGR